MDSYPIADRYSVVPAEAPLDASGYADALHSDFRNHYADGRDVWTGEAAMREAPANCWTHWAGRPACMCSTSAADAAATPRSSSTAVSGSPGSTSWPPRVGRHHRAR